MGFTRLSSSGIAVAKGRWGTIMQAAVSAKMRQESVSAAPHAAGSSNGKAASAKNKAALAAAVANTLANKAPCASGARTAPANSVTNRAMLATLLADND